METKIKINSDRTLTSENISSIVGTIGENNAEILKFEFPTDINGEAISLFTAQAVFNNTYNGTVQSYVVTIPANKEIKLTAELTTSSELTLMVQFLKGTEVKWKSCPIDLYLANSADASGVNPATTQRASDLADVKASFTENIGGTLTNKTWAELLGDSPDYNSGVLSDIRHSAELLAEVATNVIANPERTLTGSITAVSTALGTIKTTIITALNSILDPETAYTSETSWETLLTVISSLPTSVQNEIASAVTSAQGTYKTALDSAVNAIVTQYNLEISLNTDTWQNSLANLATVCEAISDLGIVPSGSLAITDNGTYDVTNYATAVVNCDTASSYIVVTTLAGALMTCDSQTYQCEVNEESHTFSVELGSHSITVSKNGNTQTQTILVDVAGVYSINLIPTLLPSAYQRVESIRSTGTQYIDTGIIPDDKKYRITFDHQNAINFPFGLWSNNNYYLVNPFNNNGMWSLFYGGNISTNRLTNVSSERKILDLTVDGQQISFNYNNFSLSQNLQGVQTSDSVHLILFARDSTHYFASTTCYEVKIWLDDVLESYLIPCYRISDNKTGLYDVVREMFLPCSGSDEFVLGADVV